MKEKLFNLTVETDVNAIECDLYSAKLIVAQAEDEIMRVEYPDANNVHVACGDGGLIISQRKKPFIKLKNQVIKIFVPAHTTPSIKLAGKRAECEVQSGIYSQLEVSVDGGAVSLSDCAFESVEILGGSVDTRINSSTIRGGLFVQVESGDVLAENAFAMHMECRVKRGNIGLVRLNCKECTFEAEKGNISATVSGGESQFNTTLLSKEGTVNRESAQHDDAENSFNAYSASGNIMLDFVN